MENIKNRVHKVNYSSAFKRGRRSNNNNKTKTHEFSGLYSHVLIMCAKKNAHDLCGDFGITCMYESVSPELCRCTRIGVGRMRSNKTQKTYANKLWKVIIIS